MHCQEISRTIRANNPFKALTRIFSVMMLIEQSMRLIIGSCFSEKERKGMVGGRITLIPILIELNVLT